MQVNTEAVIVTYGLRCNDDTATVVWLSRGERMPEGARLWGHSNKCDFTALDVEYTNVPTAAKLEPKVLAILREPLDNIEKEARRLAKRGEFGHYGWATDKPEKIAWWIKQARTAKKDA